jgi:hypothetical protein
VLLAIFLLSCIKNVYAEKEHEQFFLSVFF